MGWWWLSILVIPAVTFLTPLLRSLNGTPIDWRNVTNLIGPGIGLGVVAGFMEEFGWRGFLLPHLLKKYSPITATLLTGLVWGGLWHGYADYIGLGGQGLHSLWIILLLGPILLTAWSLIITWVYQNTGGSMIMSIAVHFSISSSALIFGQSYSSKNEELIWTSISVALAIAISVMIWFADRKAINTKNPLTHSN